MTIRRTYADLGTWNVQADDVLTLTLAFASIPAGSWVAVVNGQGVDNESVALTPSGNNLPVALDAGTLDLAAGYTYGVVVRNTTEDKTYVTAKVRVHRPGDGGGTVTTETFTVDTNDVTVTVSIAPGAPAIAPIAIPGSGIIWALGDSITANDYTAPTSTTGTRFAPRSYLMHAILASRGRLRFGGIAATGGYTSAQIVATHLPTVVAAAPQFCVVHAGTNDAGTLAQAQTLVNLRTIYTELLAAGTIPVATTMLPKETATSSLASNLQQLSLWITLEAERLGIPCIDLRSLFATNTDSWLGGSPGTYNGDNTHPNAAGAERIGDAIVAALHTYLPPAAPWLATATTQTGALAPTAANGLLLVDGNADGIPDNWAVSGATPTGSTFSLTPVDAAEGRGNWFKCHRDAAGSGTLQVNSQAVTLVPGNRMYVGIRVKTENVVANSASFDLRFTNTAGTANMWDLFTWSRDITDPAVFAATFTVPTGVTSGQFQLWLRSPCDLFVAQPTVYDLTALGLDY